MTTLKAAPLQEPPTPEPDKKPENKRPPGRPKGSKTSTSATPRAATSSRNLKPQIGGLIVTLNMALMLVPSMRLMALDNAEIDTLATAIENQAKTSPRFKKYLEAALAVSAGGQLLGVCAIIGARRAARLGVFGTEQALFVDASLGALLNSEATDNAKVVNDSPERSDTNS